MTLPKRFDLHIHSSFSDGVLNPQEVIDYFEHAGVYVISITDHNTLEAYFQKTNSGKVFVIPGVEIDIEHAQNIQFLCYGFDIHNRELQLELQKVQIARMKARVMLIRKLRRSQLFKNLDVREMCRLNDFYAICAYLAELMNKHSVKDVQLELFAEGKPFYHEIPAMEINRCIELIHGAGGVVLLAHPGRISDNTAILRELFDNLLTRGIDGFECCHPDHNSDMEDWIIRYCDQHNCLRSGGSDMHGKGVKYRVPAIGISRYWESFEHDI